MSSFTVQLRWLIENNFDFQLTEYPIFDETYRNILNQKILNHYKFREIGFETPALFRHYLKTTLNEIMPYYNQLYKSQLLQFNPLYDVDYQNTFTKTTSRKTTTAGETTNNGSGSSTLHNTNETTGSITNHSTSSDTSSSQNVDNGKTIKTDTGQGAIGITDIDSVQYATEVDFMKNSNTGSGTSSNTTDGTNNSTTSTVDSGTSSSTSQNTINNNIETDITNTDTYAQHIVGNKGNKNYSQLLNDFRTTFLNIDMEIITNPEIEQLFYGIWEG